MNRHAIYGLLGGGLVAVGAFAYADKGKSGSEPKTDAVPATQAPITLVQAVQTAELRVGGRAREAEYTHSRQGWIYEVEVVNGARVFDVHVDSTQGGVLSADEDKEEHDEHDKD